MDKLKIVLLIFAFFVASVACFAQETEQEAVRDYLYSEEYFDYLIECANEEQIEHVEQEENPETPIEITENEVNIFEFDEEISNEYEPFKIRIEENAAIGLYGETFKKEDSKTIIPVGDKFSFVQDTLKFRNKYNSDDYRVLAGVEVKPFKFFDIASGLETNYRGIDQNPTSRKLYFTPTIYFSDKVSMSFYNKFNVLTRSSDHDISLNVSPFKSKSVDFKIYTGITNYQSGETSHSVNFYTNFYLF